MAELNNQQMRDWADSMARPQKELMQVFEQETHAEDNDEIAKLLKRRRLWQARIIADAPHLLRNLYVMIEREKRVLDALIALRQAVDLTSFIPETMPESTGIRKGIVHAVEQVEDAVAGKPPASPVRQEADARRVESIRGVVEAMGDLTLHRPDLVDAHGPLEKKYQGNPPYRDENDK